LAAAGLFAPDNQSYLLLRKRYNKIITEDILMKYIKSDLFKMLLPVLLLFVVDRAWPKQPADTSFRKISGSELNQLMQEGDIPGMSIIVIKNGKTYVQGFGYADAGNNIKVDHRTLFELGSCSKAFTALAVQKLISEGRLKPEASVTGFLPWLKFTFKSKRCDITINQLLHHTSGIPWSSIAKIPETNAPDALMQTVQAINNQELANAPGKKFEYATINYDILALILQEVTGEPFEKYVKEKVFDRFQMYNTSFSQPLKPRLMSVGHKIGFFKARTYLAPKFRGNNAAGYIISNADDIARWLGAQVGTTATPDSAVIEKTHQKDESVAPHDEAAYGMGWEISLSGNGDIYHGGLNPNFTSYMIVNPGRKLAVAVLANSNSDYTAIIAKRLMARISGETDIKNYHFDNSTDNAFSVVSMALLFFILVAIAFNGMIVQQIVKGRRSFQRPGPATLLRIFYSIVALLPFLFGIFILPKAIAGFSWGTVLVWLPVSFEAAIFLALMAIAFSCVAGLLSSLFPLDDKFRRVIPSVLLFSMLSGIANMAMIMIITSSLDSGVKLKYTLFYFALTLSVYLLGRRYVQVRLIYFTRELIYELKNKLISKMFLTSYQKFEQLDKGKIFTTINDDVNLIGESTNTIVFLITNVVTVLGIFIYLATVAFWATMLTILLIVSISTLYYFVTTLTNKYYEQARDARNLFMRLTSGMVDGYKELCLHQDKKLAYQADLSASALAYKESISTADLKFVNAFLTGESLLVTLLGFVAFGMPKLFPDIQNFTIMTFIIVLLYLIGPISTILGSVPAVMNLRIAWKRVQDFLSTIYSGTPSAVANGFAPQRVESFGVHQVTFKYKQTDDVQLFHVGPVSLELKAGDLIFIVGSNGSGKTTLAKLLTGLYEPDSGSVTVNGLEVPSSQLGEFFSAVFNPSFLFEKLYNLNTENKSEEIAAYLQLLGLDKKVGIKDNKYNTIELSSGQRKRLALLQCYLEDRPIYLFDEWAADQDPGYRNFFYRILLPEMKRLGKIVIAITHDDHYFDVADQVLQMIDGQLERFQPVREVLTLDEQVTLQ
jgi:putative ATP-binding cassette transporter